MSFLVRNTNAGPFEITVKFLNFRTLENLAVQTKMQNLRVFYQKDANGTANSENSDPLGTV